MWAGRPGVRVPRGGNRKASARSQGEIEEAARDGIGTNQAADDDQRSHNGERNPQHRCEQRQLFGLLAHVFKKREYPVDPLVLALVLGDRAETAFRQSMLLSSGSLAIFWSNGIAATLSTLALLLAASPVAGRWRRARPVP